MVNYVLKKLNYGFVGKVVLFFVTQCMNIMEVQHLIKQENLLQLYSSCYCRVILDKIKALFDTGK